MNTTTTTKNGNPIIQQRLVQLTETKRVLLTLKKIHRGDGLRYANETIARLKRWQKELDVEEKRDREKWIIVDQNGKYHKVHPDKIRFQKEPNSINKTPKEIKEASQGIERMKESFTRARSVIDNQIDNEYSNVLKLEPYEIEFIEAMAKNGTKCPAKTEIELKRMSILRGDTEKG